MNNLQKFQVCTGVATPIAAALYIYFGVIYPIMKSIDYSPYNGLIIKRAEYYYCLFLCVLLLLPAVLFIVRREVL